MEKQKKNQKGITLIALVISIIVMLILAGVSLNAMVGENGIVTRAQEASRQHQIATELENLNLELAKLNIDTISDEGVTLTQDIVNYLMSKGVIDSAVKLSSGQIAFGIDSASGEQYFFGNKGENIYKIQKGEDNLLRAELTQNAIGGDITGGYALVTAENFDNTSDKVEDKGKFNITSNAEVVFLDELSGNLSINVKEGVEATVGIYAKMTLTNANISRAAINLEPGAILNLYVGENIPVTVDSGLASEPDRTGTPGTGGFAGIRVPEGATLNIYGGGIITSRGGDASNGKDSSSGDKGGSGGGGAGAGIGGNGGNGGWGNNYGITETTYKEKPTDGQAGENCGTVNIYGNTIIKAYGGAGGSGGKREQNSDISGTGGGGYPAAGIGGGGAGGGGGNHINGAGGYSAGIEEEIKNQSLFHINGCANLDVHTFYSNGGSYFQKGKTGPRVSSVPYTSSGANIGGQGCGDYQYSSLTNLNGAGNDLSGLLKCYIGSGGIAGKGGNISVSKNAQVFSYNGNECTLDEKNEDGTINNDYYDKPLEIYLQSGNPLDIYILNGSVFDYRYSIYCQVLGIEKNSNWKQATKGEEYQDYIITKEMRIANSYKVSGYKNIQTGSIYGVGSGAGYVEVSNGTYTIYNEDDNGNFTTVYAGE